MKLDSNSTVFKKNKSNIEIVSIYIPICEWLMNLIIIKGGNISSILKKKMEDEDFNEFDIRDILYNAESKSINGGCTFTKTKNRKQVVIIYPCTDIFEFIKLLNHEKCHIVDEISEYENINKEAKAFLDGYISKEIYKKLKELKFKF